MRSALYLGAITAVAACSFSAGSASQDAISGTTSAGVDGRPFDARVDARVDAVPTPRRTRQGLVLRYDFNEAAGATTVLDTSGVAPAANLRVLVNSGSAPTFTGTGLSTNGATALVDVTGTSAGAKLAAACTEAITVEAWISQSPNVGSDGRIVSFSKTDDIAQNNLVVGSVADDVAGVVRTQQASGYGSALYLPGGVTEVPQLVVLRYRSGQLKLQSLIGPSTAATDTVQTQVLTGSLAWDATFRLVMLNSTQYTSGNARSWRGTISSISFYCRNLSDTEIANDRLLGAESL
ncbi:MAG: hypothetical protein KBG15_00915 [Kofleriaceae bacterium]|nr:hypothetical protein [Kofleriaceae bacterium]